MEELNTVYCTYIQNLGRYEGYNTGKVHSVGRAPSQPIDIADLGNDGPTLE
jgi:hypothetical protein